MTPQEADKIIAEFMGYKEIIFSWGGKKSRKVVMGWEKNVLYDLEFSTDLNKLVPVWEKLRTAPRFYLMIDKPMWIRCDIPIYDGDHAFEVQCVGNYVIQEAAAIATAKAIKELKK